MPMSEVRIDYMPIDELVAAPRNPKQHMQEAIKASINRFGYVEPVVIDERTGKLVAGHGRVESLRASHGAGDEVPDGVHVTGGTWRVPVVRGWSSADDREADAYLIASNQTTEAGGWDTRELRAMLNDLIAADRPDFLALGFTDRSLEVLLAEASADAGSAWDGMPDFEQDSRKAAFSCHVHLGTEADAEAFYKLLGVKRQSSFWWPESDGLVGSSRSVQYVAGDAEVPDPDSVEVTGGHSDDAAVPR